MRSFGSIPLLTVCTAHEDCRYNGPAENEKRSAKQMSMKEENIRLLKMYASRELRNDKANRKAKYAVLGWAPDETMKEE